MAIEYMESNGGAHEHQRQLGMGRPFSGVGAGQPDDPNSMSALLLSDLQCEVSNLPVILQQRSHFTGPLTDGATGGMTKLLDADVNVLAFGGSVPDATSSPTIGLSSTGAPATPFLIYGVFAHFVPPPFNFTARGGSWTKPTAAGNAPVVPDMWWAGIDDANNGALGATSTGGLGVSTAATLRKAILNQGDWQQIFFYEMARAYNWRWKNGTQTVLLDWPLRHIAKVIPSPQSYTSAQGSFDITSSVSAVNKYYRTPPSSGTVSTDIFVPRNARWTGVAKSAGAGGVTMGSLFNPDASGDLVTPTYGGIGVQELGCNAEYFRLPRPVVFPRNTPLDMRFTVVDSTAQTNAKVAGSMTNGFPTGAAAVTGTNPFIQTIDTNITSAKLVGLGTAVGAAGVAGTGGTPVFPVLSQDTPPTVQYLTLPLGTAIYKIGDWYLTIGCIGRELNETQYDMLKASKGDLSQIVHNAGFMAPIWF